MAKTTVVAYGKCLRRSQDVDDTKDAGVLR